MCQFWLCRFFFFRTSTSRLAPPFAPRAWGRLLGDALYRAGDRFTPTCLGTMIRRVISPRSTAVHSHVRGDNLIKICPFMMDYDTPPRAWGRFDVRALHQGHLRFTPTCVGTVGPP